MVCVSSEFRRGGEGGGGVESQILSGCSYSVSRPAHVSKDLQRLTSSTAFPTGRHAQPPSSGVVLEWKERKCQDGMKNCPKKVEQVEEKMQTGHVCAVGVSVRYLCAESVPRV